MAYLILSGWQRIWSMKQFTVWSDMPVRASLGIWLGNPVSSLEDTCVKPLRFLPYTAAGKPMEVPSPHSSGKAYGGFFMLQQEKQGRCCFCHRKRKLTKLFGIGIVSTISQYQHLKAVSSLTSNVFMPGLARGAHPFCREVDILAIVGRFQLSFQKQEGILSSSECG